MATTQTYGQSSKPPVTIPEWWDRINDSITSAEIVDGELVLTQYDGDVINLGPMGGNGSTTTDINWYSGVGPPDPNSGSPNSVYIDIASGELYQFN